VTQPDLAGPDRDAAARTCSGESTWSWRRRESNPADDALHDAPIAESRALRLVGGTTNAVERSGPQRDAAESLQTVADPVAAAIEAALALRRAGAEPKALRGALRRIEQLLDE
jgi:hypothetical protein